MITPNYNKFNLKRDASGMTDTQLAALAGVSLMTVINFFKCRSCSRTTIHKIGSALHIPPGQRIISSPPPVVAPSGEEATHLPPESSPGPGPQTNNGEASPIENRTLNTAQERGG